MRFFLVSAGTAALIVVGALTVSFLSSGFSPPLKAAVHVAGEPGGFSVNSHSLDLLLQRLTAAGVPTGEALRGLIEESCRTAEVDPLLIGALIQSESSFDPGARSPAGKLGLLQIDPALGSRIAASAGVAWRGADALLEPGYNLVLGIRYLGGLRRRFQKRLVLTVAAFNIGAPERLAAVQADPHSAALLERHLEGVLSYYRQWQHSAAAPSQTAVSAVADRVPPEVPAVDAPVVVTESVVRRPEKQELPVREDFADPASLIGALICEAGIIQPHCVRIGNQIVLSSAKAGIDPLLLTALIKERSGFLWFVEGRIPGGIGLLQISAADGLLMAEAVDMAWGGGQQLRDPKYSLRLGGSYWSLLLRRFQGSQQQALAAFLAGPSAKQVAKGDVASAQYLLNIAAQWHQKLGHQKLGHQKLGHQKLG